MTTTQQERFGVLLEVRDFGVEYGARFPESSTVGEALGVVAEAIATIEARQKTRALALHDGRKGKAEARAALLEWIGNIVRSARDIARTGAGSNAKLLMPVRRSDQGLVQGARELLEVSRPLSGNFIQLGLPTDWEAQFKGAIDTLEERILGGRTGRSGVVNANTAIKEALARGFSAVRTLDTIVANSLKGDQATLDTWQKCRTVIKRAKRGATTNADVVSPPESEEVLKQAS